MALERVESQHVCFMGKPRIWKFGKIPGKFVQGLKSSISVQRKKKSDIFEISHGRESRL